MKTRKHKSLVIPFVEIFAKTISLFNILLLVRVLNINDYANYSYIVAIVLWSSVLMDGGINSLIFNKSLKREIDEVDLLFTGRFFLSILVIFGISLFFIYSHPILVLAAAIFSVITYLTSTIALIKMLSRGLGFVKVDFISILSEPIIRFVFLLFIYYTTDYFNYELWSVLFIYLIASFIAFAISRYYLSFYFALKFHFSGVNKIFSTIVFSLNQSKYYLLYYLMLVGLARIDILFLENYSEKTEIAIFSAALNMYQVAQLFFISIITSQFSKLYANGKLIFKIILPLLIVAVIVTNIISVDVFKYLFPVAYNKSPLILNILIISLVPSVINFYWVTKNNFESKVKLNFVILSIAFAIKILLYLGYKFTDGVSYSYGYLIAEFVLLLLFIINKLYENITNK